jgi:SAM-dependent methyltransferase
MNSITTLAMTLGWHHPGPGGTSPSNLDALQELCKKVLPENGMIADVGCWTGLSSVVLGFLAREYKGHVKAIDWFQGSVGTGLDAAAQTTNVHEVCKAVMRYFDLNDTVEVIKSDSAAAASLYPDETFDFVFIDGDHRYLKVLKDIDAWWPKVKQGGILSGHDLEFIIPFKDPMQVQMFNPGDRNPWNEIDSITMHLGVIRAVSERFGNKAKIEDGVIWWVQK